MIDLRGFLEIWATGGSLDEQPGTIIAIAIYEALQRYWEIVFQTVAA